MAKPELLAFKERRSAETAIVFVHGFGGNATKTWGRFPEFIAQKKALDNWDLYSLGYSTSLAPDIRGCWAADPPIDSLVTYLRTQANEPPLDRYKRITLVAHSMGGLVVQRALVDYRQDFTSRISHVMLLGTPSLGLKKARGLGAILKFQSQNMAQGSAFITDLRQRWDDSFGKERPFKLWAVAGDRDQFVPPSSSLEAFATEDCLVVPGNHLEIVKPENADSLSVKVLTSAIVGDAAPAGPWNAARVAVETGDFQRAIDRLLPVADQLDDRHLVELALALDSTGKQAEAIRVLQQKASNSTDVLGTLAGRLKRRWILEGREADARQALSLYQDAYVRSKEVGNHAQAYYHGINVAFMNFAFLEADREEKQATKKIATELLEHCAKSKRTYWCAATVGEAQFYLGDTAAGLEAYREAVGMNPTPRELGSMYSQASLVLELLEDQPAQTELKTIFKGTAA